MHSLRHTGGKDTQPPTPIRFILHPVRVMLGAITPIERRIAPSRTGYGLLSRKAQGMSAQSAKKVKRATVSAVNQASPRGSPAG